MNGARPAAVNEMSVRLKATAIRTKYNLKKWN